MLFKELVEYFEKIEKTQARNEMIVVLAEVFGKLSAKEIKQAVYIMQGVLAPAYIGLEFNFSIKLLLKSLTAKLNLSDKEINQKYAQIGDVGNFLLGVRSQLKVNDLGLSINQVYEALQKIAIIGGKNSQLHKQNMFLELLDRLGAVECKYVARIITGNMRLGVSNKTIIEGLSWYLKGDKSLKTLIEYAYGVRADMGEIALFAIEDGEDALAKINPEPGIAVASKLVQREKSLQDLHERMQEYYIQPKYDGLRLQIHISKSGFKTIEQESTMQTNLIVPVEEGATVKIYSRNMEDLTEMFPDVIKAAKNLKLDSAIIDTEAIGYDPESNKLVSFQQTISRKRKYSIEEAAKGTPLKVFAFDLLYLNGKNLINLPLQERLESLSRLIEESNVKDIVYSESIKVDSLDTLKNKFAEYVHAGLEGLIVKLPASKYLPGTRNYDWVKLKAKSQAELVDSIDAVVLGYYYGTGLRAKFGIGALLIGTYDSKSEIFLSLAKLGTGIKDEQWGEIKKRLDKIKLNEVPKQVEIQKNLVPDVVVKPEVVVVVESDEITKSPIHGGEVGFSLRFPRLKVFDRLDKNPEEITSTEELKRLFELQSVNK